MATLNWTPQHEYLQAITHRHYYRIDRIGTYDGILRVWRYDNRAPNGRTLIYRRSHPSILLAQESAEIIAEHAAK